MPSFAYLQIELPVEWTDKLDAIRGPLRKITNAYLEMRWSWPRQFTPLTDLAFLLADPRAAELEPTELRKLADELQHHLFGSGAGAEVSLLVFEGAAEAVTAFAALRPDEMSLALSDPTRLPAGGRLMRIRPGVNSAIETLTSSAGPSDDDIIAERRASPTQRQSYKMGLLGTYFLSREIFVADLLAVALTGRPDYYATIEDEAQLPSDETQFDEACFRNVDLALEKKAGGLPLGVPVAFSHFARMGLTGRLEEMLGLLPTERRSELNASIYGVPRRLAFGVGHIHSVLDPYFCTINLITADPRFEVEQLPARSVGSVVVCLRGGDAAARHAAIRAFATQADLYRRRGIRQVLANVRTAAELDLASRLDLQLVSGRAVCGLLETPIGGRAVPLARLPVTAP